MSFGGGMCNICIAYLGLPVITLGTSCAGDYIDRSAASVTGETVTSVRTFKENGFTLNRLSTDGLDHALSIYYDDVIHTAVSGLEKLLSSTQKLPKFEQPIPVAIGGGSAKVGGFEARISTAIRKVKSPVEISEVSISDDGGFEARISTAIRKVKSPVEISEVSISDPLNATANGTLMAAVLDT